MRSPECAPRTAPRRPASSRSEEDRADLLAEVDRLADEVAAGTFPWSDGDEDVHSAVERVLTERLGSSGARVHAGRSRNDLVVTDLRMRTKDACD